MLRGDTLVYEIIKQLENLPMDDSVYLIQGLTDNSGIFGLNGNLVYMVKNIEKLGFTRIDTEYLALRTHVNIIPMGSNSKFEEGYYNTLVYNEKSNNDNIETFIRLCQIHSENILEIGFLKFFHSLVKLFQLPREQQFKNLLGFYGELKFIEWVYENYKSNISLKWHIGDSYDKYDFVFTEANFEVKTITCKEKIVTIKHNQIFNGDNNFLILIMIENNNSGETLIDLIKRLKSCYPFSKNYFFNLNIERELKRVSVKEAETRRFKLQKIEAFKVDNMETIINIPDCISELKYKYNLDGIDPVHLTPNMFK